MHFERNQQVTWEELSLLDLSGTTLSWTEIGKAPRTIPIGDLLVHEDLWKVKHLIIKDQRGNIIAKRPLYSDRDGPRVLKGNRLEFGINKIGHGTLNIPGP